MSEPMNPYAPPLASLSPENPEGCWRDGKVLVMRPESALPPRCVKCNAPAVQPMKRRNLYWHHPALYILALINLLIYAIVALIVRKRASVAPGLCAEHTKRRWTGVAVGWGGTLLGVAFAIYWTANDNCGTALLGLVVILGAIITGMALARIVYPERIDKDFVRLKGCGQPFLDSLPEFNG